MESREYQSPYGAEAEHKVRRWFRDATLSSLAAAYKLSGRMEALDRNRIQFIYLHHIFEEEEAPFRQLLQFLSRRHTLIGYSEAVAKLWSGDIDRPYVCVSFDDGLKNCLSAARILDEFGVSGCFFICPAMVGETDPHRLKEFCVRKLTLPPTELLDWGDVDQLLAAGHEIGSHTMSHHVLAHLTAGQVRDEVAGSYETLTRRLGEVRHFAWPEGLYSRFSAEAARAVFQAGYQSCASAERGCHVQRPETMLSGLCLRRDYIAATWPHDHVAYFLAANSRSASANSNLWPNEWMAQISPSIGAGSFQEV
jgi:peptidoglycan/xylan/chitin deacetylase (PgdA/CDA1 family)